jgi:hypothetical protein
LLAQLTVPKTAKSSKATGHGRIGPFRRRDCEGTGENSGTTFHEPEKIGAKRGAIVFSS